MKVKRIVCLLLITMVIISCIGSVMADEIRPYASNIFVRASISVDSSMTATFSAVTSQSTTISVSSCSLEKKVDGVWKSAGSLTAPASSSGTTYDKSKGYSSSCTSGVTYRIVATFKAGTETISRTSNEIKY